MNGFGKQRADAEQFASHRRRYFADCELKQIATTTLESMNKHTKNPHLRTGQELDRSFALAQLLDGVTGENIHCEVDTGPAVGGEVW